MILRRLALFGITRYDTQVIVDFEALGPGIIAFAGANGAGKTTLLEASGAGALFRELPTRDPKAIHACTRPTGGWVQLDFDLGTDSYTAKIDIDKKGTQQAYLSKNGQPIVSGKVRDFDQAIAQLLGSPEAFYASVFGLQGGGGKIASLTVGDRKAIFRWFLGLDRLAMLRDRAQKRAVGLDGKEVDRLTADQQTARDQHKEVAAQIPDLDKALTAAQAVDKAARKARTAATAAIALVTRRVAMVAEIARLDRDLATKTAVARQKIATRDQVKTAAPVDPGEAPADPAIARKTLQDALQLQREADVAAADARAATAKHAQAKIDADRADRASGLLANVPCGGGEGFDGCQFLKDAVTARSKLADLRIKEVDAAGLADDAARHAQVKIDATAGAITGDLQQQVRAAEIAQANWQAARTALDQYGAKMAAAVADARSAVEAAKAASEARKVAPDPIDAPDIDVASLDAAVATAARQVAAATGAVEKAKGRIEELDRQIDVTTSRLKEAKQRAADLPALQFLAKALGPDGIQALEIDAAGPQVSAMANDLLLSCYGPRFTVEIQTQRATKAAGTAEDLEIIVLDADEGRSGPLGSLSGGEQVIVDEAVRTALAMFAARRLPSPIATLWRDEPAGALSPDNARRYVQMLRRASEIGGFHQILFVAHDPDLIAIADVVVRVHDDGMITTDRPG